MNRYSDAQKRRVLRALADLRLSQKQACESLGISASTVCGWRKDLASPGMRASEAAHARRYGRGPWTHTTKPSTKPV